MSETIFTIVLFLIWSGACVTLGYLLCWIVGERRTPSNSAIVDKLAKK